MQTAAVPDDQYLDSSVLGELRLLQQPGEPDVLHEVIQTFLGDCERRMVHAGHEVARADLHGLAETAHQVKGSASLVGAARVAGLAASLERASRSGAADEAAILVPQLVAAFHQTRVLLQRIAEGGE